MIEVQIQCEQCSRVERSEHPESLGAGAKEHAELLARFIRYGGKTICPKCCLAILKEERKQLEEEGNY